MRLVFHDWQLWDRRQTDTRVSGGPRDGEREKKDQKKKKPQNEIKTESQIKNTTNQMIASAQRSRVSADRAFDCQPSPLSSQAIVWDSRTKPCKGSVYKKRMCEQRRDLFFMFRDSFALFRLLLQGEQSVCCVLKRCLAFTFGWKLFQPVTDTSPCSCQINTLISRSSYFVRSITAEVLK